MIKVSQENYSGGLVVFKLTCDTNEEFEKIWPPYEFICECVWRNEVFDEKTVITQEWTPGCKSHPDGVNINYPLIDEDEDFLHGLAYPVAKTVMK